MRLGVILINTLVEVECPLETVKLKDVKIQFPIPIFGSFPKMA
jgi:hypothetical protein